MLSLNYKLTNYLVRFNFLLQASIGIEESLRGYAADELLPDVDLLI